MTAERAAAGAALASMTGFARAAGNGFGHSWTVEAKSVNGRSLDVRVRTPPGLDGVEVAIRRRVGDRFRRGAIQVTVEVDAGGRGQPVRVDHALLDALVALARRHAPDGTVRIEPLLGVRGVVEAGGTGLNADEALEAAIGETAAAALGGLVDARVAEGRHLAAVLFGLLDEIAEATGRAAALAAVQPAALRARLAEQVAALLGAGAPVPEERLAQEVALLAARADVREEIDRLSGHVAAARALLAEGGPVGRRLDFLCQELNREANTLCAKSSDRELTATGLDLKTAIDRLREQVQNLE